MGVVFHGAAVRVLGGHLDGGLFLGSPLARLAGGGYGGGGVGAGAEGAVLAYRAYVFVIDRPHDVGQVELRQTATGGDGLGLRRLLVDHRHLGLELHLGGGQGLGFPVGLLPGLAIRRNDLDALDVVVRFLVRDLHLAIGHQIGAVLSVFAVHRGFYGNGTVSLCADQAGAGHGGNGGVADAPLDLAAVSLGLSVIPPHQAVQLQGPALLGYGAVLGGMALAGIPQSFVGPRQHHGNVLDGRVFLLRLLGVFLGLLLGVVGLFARPLLLRCLVTPILGVRGIGNAAAVLMSHHRGPHLVHGKGEQKDQKEAQGHACGIPGCHLPLHGAPPAFPFADISITE